MYVGVSESQSHKRNEAIILHIAMRLMLKLVPNFLKKPVQYRVQFFQDITFPRFVLNIKNMHSR